MLKLNPTPFKTHYMFETNYIKTARAGGTNISGH